MNFLTIAVLVMLAEFPTTRFYDARGNLVGSATVYSGGVTKLYDARGNLKGTIYDGKDSRNSHR